MLCGEKFHAKTTELWVCPYCEESGYSIFSVLDISQDEINEMYERLNWRETSGRKEQISLPSIIRDSQSVYVSINRYDARAFIQDLEENLSVLPLIFDRIFVRNLEFVPGVELSSHLKDLIFNLSSSRIIVPIVSDYLFLREFKDIGIEPIAVNDIIGYPTWCNLMKVMTYEDLHALRSKNFQRTLRKAFLKEFGPEPCFSGFWFYNRLTYVLEKYNTDLLLISRMQRPFIVEPFVNELHSWKIKRIANLCEKDFGKSGKVLRRFLNCLNISIPTGLTYDDIKAFRKEKAFTNFQKAFFTVTQKFQGDFFSDMTQELLIEFYRAKSEFDELANSYAEKGALVLTGIVSTIGGLISGPSGAILSGIGTSALYPVTKAIFKKIYENTHKNWVYFIWKWKTKYAHLS
jgi:hypothetical protein